MLVSKMLIFGNSFKFSYSRNALVTSVEEPHLKIASFNNYKLAVI